MAGQDDNMGVCEVAQIYKSYVFSSRDFREIPNLISRYIMSQAARGPRQVVGGVNGEEMGVDSHLGWFDLFELPLELVPCRRGCRGSARHLCSVKTPAITGDLTPNSIRD